MGSLGGEEERTTVAEADLVGEGSGSSEGRSFPKLGASKKEAVSLPRIVGSRLVGRHVQPSRFVLTLNKRDELYRTARRTSAGLKRTYYLELKSDVLPVTDVVAIFVESPQADTRDYRYRHGSEGATVHSAQLFALASAECKRK